MRKVFIILLMIIYLIPAMGLNVNIHFCGGKFSSISFFDSEGSKCKCGKMASTKNCCKDYQKTYKLLETPNFIAQVKSISNVGKLLFEIYLVQISLEIIESFHFVFYKQIPPKLFKQHLYLDYNIFRI